MQWMKSLLAFSLAAILAHPVYAQRNLSGTPEIKLALDKLNVLGSVLMIAAHPDDENTAVIAYWARGRKTETAYLSLTRGEGGQNLIGSEQGDMLGVIRTQELLAARRIDGGQQFFSRAIDFGFTKTPQEAFEKWGHDAVLGDVVWVIRKYQPDVIILRFSGTPRDGHGQHQASAILGKEAFSAAADKSKYSEQLQYVSTWQAKRAVWNSFNFTPEQEKEAAAMKNKVDLDTGVWDPLLGKSYTEIAGISRSEHRSQGMGSPERRGPSPNMFVPVAGDPAKQDLFDGIDITWARVPGGEKIGAILAKAASTFIPEHPERTVPLLLEARPMIASLAANKNAWAARKLTEIDEAAALCSGLWVEATSDRFSAVQGGKLKVNLTAIDRTPFAESDVTVNLDGPGGGQTVKLEGALKTNQPVTKSVELTLPAGTPVSQPYWLIKPHSLTRYEIDDQQLIGRADTVPVMLATFSVKAGGQTLSLVRPVAFRYVDKVRGELTRPLTVYPPVALNLPQTVITFTDAKSRKVAVMLQANTADLKGELHIEADAGWTVAPATMPFDFKTAGEEREVSFTATPVKFGPETGPPARFRIVANVGGSKVETGALVIDYEHIPPQTLFRPSSGLLRTAPLTLLSKNVGYVMGAGDEVPDSLKQMGCDVTLLSESDLVSGNLSRFDAIVTGVRAYNVRADVRANQQRLLDYVQAGGTLIVQYNVMEDRRFSQGPVMALDRLGPYPMTLSRDRVTVEEAPVEFLSMKAPILRAPNKISASDFDGWVQERGLYFASEWDPRYQAVIETHDPGEKPMPGGMLYTKYGKGAYIFTAYSWFRQLPAGVPGAYRIFANMLSAGKAE
jgi:LmbE family N-acetylglucosaminyl deacetylase